MNPKIDFLHLTDRVGVKVCGFTEADNLIAADGASVDAVGLNFFPKSKRYLDPETAVDWVPSLKVRSTLVGLFVNASTDHILRLRDLGLFEVAQLHGEESPRACAELIEEGVPVIKAVGVRTEESIRDLELFGTPYLLLDAYQPETRGGGGETFDWSLAKKAVDAYPEHRVLLAGGLGPENVADAVSAVRPAAVDAASGVETSPGLKDAAKVARFVEASRI